jgi:hypothetical protein
MDRALSAVDNSADMPDVINQGTGMNSCQCWAVGYYYKTYQERREHGWAVDTPEHWFSPSFIWNQLNGGTNTGISLGETFGLLQKRGCAPWSLMPYTADCTVFPNTVQCEGAMSYRSASAGCIFYGDNSATPEDIDTMKSALAGGDVLVVGIRVFTDFASISGPEYLYDGPGPSATPSGRHAVTIVGYDDAKGGIGAFKCYNSWGTGWGDGGKAWLSYGYIEEHASEAWTMVDRIDYTPRAWARIDIAHPRRGQLRVMLGCGSHDSPDWLAIVYGFAGGNNPDIHTSYDITEVTEHLPPSATHPWFLSVEDFTSGYEGNITSFSIVCDGVRYLPVPPSVDPQNALPKDISDDGTGTPAYVDIGHDGVSISVSPPNPGTGDDLLASLRGDGSGCVYAWYRNGVLQPDLTTDTVSHERTCKGETWKCVVTPPFGSPAEAEVTIGNTPSVVEWVGESGYAGDGVSPDSGDPADSPSPTTFVFKARYTDADGDAPTRADCILQLKGCGEPWRAYRVLPLTLESGEAATGAIYSCSAKLPNVAVKYRFHFVDADGPSAGVPNTYQQGPFVSGAPHLAWTGATGFTADGVAPDDGPVGTRFRFQVLYADSAGDAPATHELLIRRDGRLYRQKSLLPAPVGDYRLGKLYRTSVILNRPGVYGYCFRFTDADGAALGPPGRWQSAPSVADGASALAVTSLAAVPSPVGAQVVFGLSSAANVTATAINIAGRPVRTIVRDRLLEAGMQTLVWDRKAENGLPVPSGAYLIRVDARDRDGRQTDAMTTVMVR